MKSIFLALTCVVFAYAQVLTYTNEFVTTVEKTTTTNLIRLKNNGNFNKNGKNTISSIKFKIDYDNVKPKTARATFVPEDDKFFGAIVGGSEGFLYFNVNGNEGTYQCRLTVKYYDSNGKQQKADPYRFTFTIAKKPKNAREVVIGRVRPSEIEEHAGWNETEIFVTEGVVEPEVQEVAGEIQSRQTNNNCPTPSDSTCIWTGCNLASAWPQATANTITFKNQLPSGSTSTMNNIYYTFTNKSPSTGVAINSAPTTLVRLGTATIQLTITSNGNCNTWFTFNVNFNRGSGSTVYTWSTDFHPIDTYPANSSWTCTYN